MFLEWWMIGVLGVATGAWAEYRNIVGYNKGVRSGIEALLTMLYDERVIEISEDGKIFPARQRRSSSAKKREKQPATER